MKAATDNIWYQRLTLNMKSMVYTGQYPNQISVRLNSKCKNLENLFYTVVAQKVLRILVKFII